MSPSKEVERDGSEAEPDRAVGRSEGEDRVDKGDRRIAVEHGGDHVQRDEDEREQREVAVESRDDETRPADAPPTGGAGDAEHDDHRQQEKRDHTEAPRRVPERVGVHSDSTGQPATTVLLPSRSTSRAGRRRAASHAGASSSMNDAVLATFASTHVLAATVTVRQRSPAGPYADQQGDAVRSGRSATAARWSKRSQDRRR